MRLPWSECKATGFAPDRPVWLTTWLMIQIVDNIIHITIEHPGDHLGGEVRMRLPLRDGDTGRFLGHLYDGERSTPQVEETKWLPDFALFRNATAGVTFQWNGAGSWVPTELVNDPNGCRHCDHPEADALPRLGSRHRHPRLCGAHRRTAA